MPGSLGFLLSTGEPEAFLMVERHIPTRRDEIIRLICSFGSGMLGYGI